MSSKNKRQHSSIQLVHQMHRTQEQQEQQQEQHLLSTTNLSIFSSGNIVRRSQCASSTTITTTTITTTTAITTIYSLQQKEEEEEEEKAKKKKKKHKHSQPMSTDARFCSSDVTIRTHSNLTDTGTDVTDQNKTLIEQFSTCFDQHYHHNTPVITFPMNLSTHGSNPNPFLHKS
jgi:flagellar biosynthesis component FlhA